jgi:hypothetical protein
VWSNVDGSGPFVSTSRFLRQASITDVPRWLLRPDAGALRFESGVWVGIVGGFLVSLPICGIVTGLYIAAFSIGQVATGVHNLTDYDIEHYDQ